MWRVLPIRHWAIVGGGDGEAYALGGECTQIPIHHDGPLGEVAHRTIGFKRRNQKCKMAGEIMAGRERKYTPRARTTRPIGEARTSNAPPNQPLQPPVNRNGLWFIPEPLSHRLHEKVHLANE